jgi:hypothetical protein
MASPEQNIPWSPPDGSNNGSNKCWVNAPLYTILSNDEIRERVKNIGNPNEDQLRALSAELKLPTIASLKDILDNPIDKLTDQDVPDIVTNKQIYMGLANAINDTLLNRLHITIFLLVVRNTLISVDNYNDVLPNIINVTLDNFSIDSLRGDLSPLYVPALKQFVNDTTPWTDVLYRTFALFMLKRGDYDVNPNMVIGNASGSAMDTINFIQNVILQPSDIIIGYTPELINDQNTISIVAATKCTSTTEGQASEHFFSFVKKNDTWFQVDALHGTAMNSNFTAINQPWTNIENIHNCTNEPPLGDFAVDSEVEFESGQRNVQGNIDWSSGKITQIIGDKLTISHGTNESSTVNINIVRWPKKKRTMFSISYTPLQEEKAQEENLTEAARIATETEAARIATETAARETAARETAARETAVAEQERATAAATTATAAATEEQKPSPFFQTIIEQLPENSTSQPNKGYINLLNIAFTRYNQNERPADSKLSLDKFKPTDKKGKQVNYSPITNDNFKEFETDINALYRAAVAAGNSEIRKRSGGGKKTRKARLPPQKKPVTSNRTRSRNRDGKKRIR